MQVSRSSGNFLIRLHSVTGQKLGLLLDTGRPRCRQPIPLFFAYWTPTASEEKATNTRGVSATAATPRLGYMALARGDMAGENSLPPLNQSASRISLHSPLPLPFSGHVHLASQAAHVRRDSWGAARGRRGRWGFVRGRRGR
jgi:hypothetical protein